jgi:hypothetical protein
MSLFQDFVWVGSLLLAALVVFDTTRLPLALRQKSDPRLTSG